MLIKLLDIECGVQYKEQNWSYKFERHTLKDIQVQKARLNHLERACRQREKVSMTEPWII